MHLLPGNLQFDRCIQWFFSQASWAYNQVVCFQEKFLGICGEDVNASLAAERVIGIGITVRHPFIFADSKAYQRATACWANKSVHVMTPFSASEGASIMDETAQGLCQVWCQVWCCDNHHSQPYQAVESA